MTRKQKFDEVLDRELGPDANVGYIEFESSSVVLDGEFSLKELRAILAAQEAALDLPDEC